MQNIRGNHHLGKFKIHVGLHWVHDQAEIRVAYDTCFSLGGSRFPQGGCCVYCAFSARFILVDDELNLGMRLSRFKALGESQFHGVFVPFVVGRWLRLWNKEQRGYLVFRT